jgi:hypothetical protein
MKKKGKRDGVVFEEFYERSVLFLGKLTQC